MKDKLMRRQDYIRGGHGHKTEARADLQQLQDHRRSRRERPHCGQRVHHTAVRVQRHHPQRPHPPLQAVGERQDTVVTDASRMEGKI